MGAKNHMTTLHAGDGDDGEMMMYDGNEEEHCAQNKKKLCKCVLWF